MKGSSSNTEVPKSDSQKEDVSLQSLSNPDDLAEKVRELMGDDIEIHDRKRFTDAVGDRWQIILAHKSKVETLTQGDLESIELSCISWVIGSKYCVVFTGRGDTSSYNTATLKSAHTSIENAVKKACKPLSPIDQEPESAV